MRKWGTFFIIGIIFPVFADKPSQPALKTEMLGPQISSDASLAQELTDLPETLASLPEWRKQLEELRANSEEFKKFVYEVLKRRLASDLAFNMRHAGFSEADIDDTLKSKSFATFAKNVLSNQRVKAMVDGAVYQITAPGVVENLVEKKQLQLQELQKEAKRDAARKLFEYRQGRREAPEEFSVWKWVTEYFQKLFI